MVGVSGDSVANHQLFKKVKDLNFTLLADEKGAIAKAFGVPTKAGGHLQVQGGGRRDARAQARRHGLALDLRDRQAGQDRCSRKPRSNAAEDAKAVAAAVDALNK